MRVYTHTKENSAWHGNRVPKICARLIRFFFCVCFCIAFFVQERKIITSSNIEYFNVCWLPLAIGAAALAAVVVIVGRCFDTFRLLPPLIVLPKLGAYTVNTVNEMIPKSKITKFFDGVFRPPPLLPLLPRPRLRFMPRVKSARGLSAEAV